MKESFRKFRYALNFEVVANEKYADDFSRFVEKVFYENKNDFLLEDVTLDFIDANAIYLRFVPASDSDAERIFKHIVQFTLSLRMLWTHQAKEALIVSNEEDLTFYLYAVGRNKRALVPYELTRKAFVDLWKFLNYIEDGNGSCRICPLKHYLLTLMSRATRHGFIQENIITLFDSIMQIQNDMCYGCKRRVLTLLTRENLIDAIIWSAYLEAELISKINMPSKEVFKVFSEILSLAISSSEHKLELDKLLLSLIIIYAALLHREIIILIEPEIKNIPGSKKPEVILLTKENIIKVIEMHFSKYEHLFSSSHFALKLLIPISLNPVVSRGFNVHYIYIAYCFDNAGYKSLKVGDTLVFLVTSKEDIKQAMVQMINQLDLYLRLKSETPQE